ncbi:hypothetical protein M3J09_013816 [Ascochyta lentis]
MSSTYPHRKRRSIYYHPHTQHCREPSSAKITPRPARAINKLKRRLERMH